MVKIFIFSKFFNKNFFLKFYLVLVKKIESMIDEESDQNKEYELPEIKLVICFSIY